jgi:hypothetical protein
MVFVSAAVSAAQKPRQPYGTGHLFPAAHSGIYPPKPLRLTRLYVAGVAGQVAYRFSPVGAGLWGIGGDPQKGPPLNPGKKIEGGFICKRIITLLFYRCTGVFNAY